MPGPSPRPVAFFSLSYPSMDVKSVIVQGISHGSQLPCARRHPRTTGGNTAAAMEDRDETGCFPCSEGALRFAADGRYLPVAVGWATAVVPCSVRRIGFREDTCGSCRACCAGFLASSEMRPGRFYWFQSTRCKPA
jgi:hypothetical protein